VLHLRAGFGADISVRTFLQPNLLVLLYLHWNLGPRGDLFRRQVGNGPGLYLLGHVFDCSFLLRVANLRQHTRGGWACSIFIFGSFFSFRGTYLQVQRTSKQLVKLQQKEVNGHIRQQATNENTLREHYLIFLFFRFTFSNSTSCTARMPFTAFTICLF
jgi:hypothetical protein